MKRIKLLLSSIITLPILSTSLITLTSCIDNDKAKEAFRNDTWENVMKYADEGLDKLKQVYNLSSFVGLERKIRLNGQTHIVRVIGENHDTIAGTNKKAALTFQTVTLLSDTSGYPLVTKWNNSGNSSYPDSQLFKCLNSDVAVEWESLSEGTSECNASVHIMLEMAGITPKKVTKIGTKRKNPTSGDYIPISYDCYCFPLTFTETGFTNCDHVNTEGTIYKYWSEHTTRDDKVKKDAKGNGFFYWLESPTTNASYKAFSVGTIGITNEFNVQVSIGIDFGFCI